MEPAGPLDAAAADLSDEHSLAWAADTIGDRWSLIIIGQIMRGVGRFNDIRQRTGIPRDRLAARLRRLETCAVIAREPYCTHPPRFEYVLTASGDELAAAIGALERWGRRHSRDHRS
jgi:DNA-binding HxlR family transcriptional regulator